VKDHLFAAPLSYPLGPHDLHTTQAPQQNPMGEFAEVGHDREMHWL
jgi:hypothetical protein